MINFVRIRSCVQLANYIAFKRPTNDQISTIRIAKTMCLLIWTQYLYPAGGMGKGPPAPQALPPDRPEQKYDNLRKYQNGNISSQTGYDIPRIEIADHLALTRSER